MNTHRSKLLSIHSAQIDGWSRAKDFVEEFVHSGDRNRQAGASGYGAHRRCPGDSTSITGPGNFVETVLEFFVVGIGIHPELIGVFPLGLRKADQVFDLAILRVAAFGSCERVARSTKSNG